jgi:hypothetical protein
VFLFLLFFDQFPFSTIPVVLAISSFRSVNDVIRFDQVLLINPFVDFATLAIRFSTSPSAQEYARDGFIKDDFSFDSVLYISPPFLFSLSILSPLL